MEYKTCNIDNFHAVNPVHRCIQRIGAKKHIQKNFGTEYRAMSEKVEHKQFLTS